MGIALRNSLDICGFPTRQNFYRQGAKEARELSDFGKEIEEGVDALPQLRFDLLPRSFEDMHRDARGVTVFQLNGCLAYLFDFIRGQQP
jgi:hypothetical protein